METGVVRRSLDFTRRNKKWIILMGLIGFSSYGAYKVYHMPSIVRKRKRIMKLVGALLSMAEMVSESAETITVLSQDMKEFLQADSDEIPKSLRQLSKIARSEDFPESVILVTKAMIVGILRGYQVENSTNESQDVGQSSFPERVMDKLMSSAGTGFVSVVVGNFAMNLVLGFYGSGGSGEGLNGKSQLGESYAKSSFSTLSGWLDMVSDDKCCVLLAHCIKTFVSTAVSVYLDKTMDANFYDDVFSGLTNPKHQNKVTYILVSLCNGAVETLVKTSHQVLTHSKQSPVNDSISNVDTDEASNLERNKNMELTDYFREELNGSFDIQNSGWVNSVSSTLSVSSNRKFLLEVTGRVTFEMVRSIIEYCLWKTSDAMKGSMNMVHDEVLERGFQVSRYVGSKSSVILTICLALFLHILGDDRVLLPA